MWGGFSPGSSMVPAARGAAATTQQKATAPVLGCSPSMWRRLSLCPPQGDKQARSKPRQKGCAPSTPRQLSSGRRGEGRRVPVASAQKHTSETDSAAKAIFQPPRARAGPPPEPARTSCLRVRLCAKKKKRGPSPKRGPCYPCVSPSIRPSKKNCALITKHSRLVPHDTTTLARISLAIRGVNGTGAC